VFIFLLSSIPGAKVPGPFPFMDKLAHMLEYSLFGLLVGRAIRFTWTGAGRVFMTLGAVGIGATTGLLDELYQSRVPGRSSDPYDWIVDVLAVATAVLITQVVSAKPIHNRTQE
jgi:VanZ family protein